MSGEPPPAPSDPILTTGILRRAGGSIAAPAGELGLQGIVRRGGWTGRLDDLLGWAFHLIALDFDPAQLLTVEQREFLAAINGRALGIVDDPDAAAPSLAFDVDGAYAAFFAEHGVVAMLVRPDFTIFGGARAAADVGPLLDDLQAQLPLVDLSQATA
jgi:hypothetical protein